ncbi:uncharacterized protein [Palaemon carinicauda]|uniref:uncharacterized protein n=1 Tax=Palaemon carinicauda TaxID=392227 RepID=UPI0035B60A3C
MDMSEVFVLREFPEKLLQNSNLFPTAQLDLTEKKRVILLQESLLKNTQSYALWDGKITETMSALTLCYRVKIFYYRPEVIVFSYIDENSLKLRTDHNRIGMQVLLSGHNYRVDTGIITPLMHWSSFCLGFDAKTAQFVLFFNGEKWKKRQIPTEENSYKTSEVEESPIEPTGDGTFTPKGEVLMREGGTIVLGQDQDAPLSDFDATQSFRRSTAMYCLPEQRSNEIKVIPEKASHSRNETNCMAANHNTLTHEGGRRSTAMYRLPEQRSNEIMFISQRSEPQRSRDQLHGGQSRYLRAAHVKDFGLDTITPHISGIYSIALAPANGAVADVNLWSRLLSDQEMAAISGCQSRIPGDVIDWDTAQWTIGPDASQTEEPLKDTCDLNPAPYFMFPVKVQFLDAVRLCKAFGGEIATPRNPQEQELVYQLAEKNSQLCAKDGGALTWLGITDEIKEGEWKLRSNDTRITYFNWGKGQPNGKTIENCAVMKGNTHKGQWADQQCRKSFKVCVMCFLRLPVFIRFRGICDATLYDDRFVMAGMKNQKPYFRGYYRSQLYFTDEGFWKLERIGINDTYATKEDDGSISFPIGRHLWTFSHGFCEKEKGAPLSLTFTQCAKNDEFTCDDGTCIPIREVCDRRVQCQDLSDETDCSMVVLPRGYQTTLPPPSQNMNNPLPVYFNLTLNSFEKIDAINNEFAAEITVRMIWKDMRLMFKNLRRDRQLNIILPSEANTIWIPTVDFLNAENNQHTLVDNECKITIKRLGQPLPDNIEYSREARHYKGVENYIRIVRKYTVTFRCNFNFFYFPFTTDYCNMVFRMNKNTETYVTLEKYGPGIRYKRQDQLTEYNIGEVYMERLTSDEPYSGLVTVIEMKHLFMSEIVTIFIPTTLINLISFTTFFFKWFDFQNRIMVSLTALLVLTTLFAQIADNLPKTSYFKLIDIWFFGSIVFAFITILIHTAVEFYHHYDAPTNSQASATSSAFQSSAFQSPTATKNVRTKIVPVSEVEGDRKFSFGERRKATQPHSKSIAIHRIGKIVTLSVYVLFSVVFWIVAFLQKVMAGRKVRPGDEEVATAYPE